MDIDPVDPAVQAFEVLRTEIALLSADITQALAEQRAILAKPAPNYDLTLGRIAKQLAELTTRAAAARASRPWRSRRRASETSWAPSCGRKLGLLARIIRQG